MFGVRCHDCQGAGACTSCFLTRNQIARRVFSRASGEGRRQGGGGDGGARCLSGQGMTGPIIKHHLVWPSHVSECECLLQEEDGNQRDDKRMTLGQSLVHVESKGLVDLELAGHEYVRPAGEPGKAAESRCWRASFCAVTALYTQSRKLTAFLQQVHDL